MKTPILAVVTGILLNADVAFADELARPNVLFILADDTGWQDASVPFGPERTAWNDRYRTPALERMAREGMKFTQAYACAVCSPTRVSLMTGQNAVRHGVTQWTYPSGDQPASDLEHPALSHADWNWNGLQPVPGLDHAVSVPTLPSLLKQDGYRTMHFGKGHLPAVIRRHGCGSVDQRNVWQHYLTERGLEVPALLHDGAHLSDEGCRVMAACVKASLVKRDEPP